MNNNGKVYLLVLPTAFLLHFPWEMWQIPFFVQVPELSHWDGVMLCTRAAVGDAFISLAAYAVASITFRHAAWPLSLDLRPTVVYLLVGLCVTIFFEYLATDILDRWQYSEAMPVLSLTGTGMLPLIQWIVIPLIVLVTMRLFINGIKVE